MGYLQVYLHLYVAVEACTSLKLTLKPLIVLSGDYDFTNTVIDNGTRN